jgi:hypothetical protein
LYCFFRLLLVEVVLAGVHGLDELCFLNWRFGTGNGEPEHGRDRHCETSKLCGQQSSDRLEQAVSIHAAEPSRFFLCGKAKDGETSTGFVSCVSGRILISIPACSAARASVIQTSATNSKAGLG